MTFRPLQHIVPIIVALLGSVACGYTNLPEPSDEWPEVSANAPLSLAAECAQEGVPIPQGVCFGGVVTANDKSGNFYKSIVVEDASESVELHIEHYDLHNTYPVGAEVVIGAEGLAVMEVDGVVQMGRKIASWSDYKVEPLGVPALIDERVAVVGKGAKVKPRRVAIDTLTERMCGRCVRVDSLAFVGDHSDWGSNIYSSTAYRLFRTPQGDSVAVSTSRYADFATQPLPTGLVSVGGILYHDRLFGADMFLLKSRTYEDIRHH